MNPKETRLLKSKKKKKLMNDITWILFTQQALLYER